MPQPDGRKVLVVGLGNLLLGDDGVGVHAVRALAGTPPSGARLMEVGTNVLGALDEIEDAWAVIALDALDGGMQPGAVLRVELSPNERRATPPSLHELDVAGVLGLLPPDRRPRIVVLGVQPATLEAGIGLSPRVEAALPRLLWAVRREVDDLRCNCPQG
jgi:hydrogenase maturation protease